MDTKTLTVPVNGLRWSVLVSFAHDSTRKCFVYWRNNYHTLIQHKLILFDLLILSLSIRTLFLISSPEVLHAGTPTLLAVTVSADFSGRVTAELTHGDISVAQTLDFQGGDAAIAPRFRVDLHNDVWSFRQLKHHSVFTSRSDQSPHAPTCEYISVLFVHLYFILPSLRKSQHFPA